MSTTELEPVRPPRLRLNVQRRIRRMRRRATQLSRDFMSTPKDVRITGAQFVCLLAGLYFVSWWSIPVAGVIGAVLVIVALERQ